MATASDTLAKLSVQPEGGANQNLLMPKLQYRFRVNFINFGFDDDSSLILTRQVVDCARPQVQFDEITKDVSLIVTDFADDDEEVEESKLLWTNQIADLKKVLGST